MNDLITILPILSLLIAGASFYFARKHDTKADASSQAAVVVDVRAIREDIAELKSDMKALRAEYKQDHDDIVKLKSRMDTEFKTMWTRIDELKAIIQGK